MAYDKDRHEFDPKTGYMVEKHTKEVVGQKAWPLPKHEHDGAEYPKWVKDKTTNQPLLVANEAEEERALKHEHDRDNEVLQSARKASGKAKLEVVSRNKPLHR